MKRGSCYSIADTNVTGEQALGFTLLCLPGEGPCKGGLQDLNYKLLFYLHTNLLQASKQGLHMAWVHNQPLYTKEELKINCAGKKGGKEVTWPSCEHRSKTLTRKLITHNVVTYVTSQSSPCPPRAGEQMSLKWDHLSNLYFLGITFFPLLPDLKVQFARIISPAWMEAFKVEAFVS